MRRWVILTVLMWSAWASSAARAEEAQAALQPLRVQVVLSRTLGDKKVSSLPYTLSLSTGERGAALRMGVQIPLTVRVDASQPATVMFKDVGTNLDCRADSLEGGRYNLVFSVEQGSLASGEWSAVSSSPVLRSFKANSSLVLRDGQSGRFVAATDPVTGEVLQVDVTLTVVK
jgi:Flp pilus assembly secretin CpaC